MFEYLMLPEYQRAFVAAILSGILLPEIGVLMVLERFTFAGAGITHIAFSGVTLFILLGINPILGALVFAVLAAFMMWHFLENKGVNLDAGMGILFAFFMALAILFMSLSSGYSGEALSYLFGSILTVSVSDIVLLVAMFLLVQIFLVLFHRDIFLLLLNRELAEASGVNVKNIRLFLLVLLAVVITVSMKIMGALLVIGMAVMPAVSSLKIKNSFIPVIVFSGIIGAFAAIVGFVVALFLNTPPSATMVIVTFVVFIVIVSLKRR